jgi:hypothetical protein
VENWTLLTDRARVLLAIAGDPGIRLRDIAATLGITERTARAIITDLPSAGYVIRHKDGRRNRYQIQGRLLLPGRPSSNPPSANCSTSSPARGRQRTTSWRQPDGARAVLLTRRTAIPGITAPRRGRCPNRHRHIAPPASRRSARPAVPRKSCR